MDKETLVAADIDTGERLIEELAKAGYPAEAVFWLYDSTLERWRLWISTERAEHDRRDAYKGLNDIIDALNAEGHEISLSDINLVEPDDSLVKGLDKKLHMKETGRKRIKSLIVGRYFLEDIVVYRTAA